MILYIIYIYIYIWGGDGGEGELFARARRRPAARRKGSNFSLRQSKSPSIHPKAVTRLHGLALEGGGFRVAIGIGECLHWMRVRRDGEGTEARVSCLRARAAGLALEGVSRVATRIGECRH